jgi:hypothetical protein
LKLSKFNLQMNDDRNKLKQVQQEIRELTAKQLALQKQQLDQHKEYERQKTTYQLLFGQPSLPQDPELVSVTAQIARLGKDKENYFKVIQVSFLTNTRQLLLSHNHSQRRTGQKLRSIQRP